MAVWTKEIKEGRKMRNITNTFRHILTALLTIAALVAGQSAALAQDPANIGSIQYNSTLGAYEINCAQHLSDLAEYVNGEYRIEKVSNPFNTNVDNSVTVKEPHDCAGLTFKMTADIDFAPTSAWDDYGSDENNYTAIGWEGTLYVFGQEAVGRNPFSGTFDGQNHTISGIRVNKGGDWYQGLFGIVKSGTVRNVTLADARIKGRYKNGGIAGENIGGTIENCHATGTVAVRTESKDANFVGGIVGSNYVGDTGATVTRCTSAAVITNSNKCTYYGGIAGYNKEGCTISDCTAAGVILPDITNSGAVVGDNYGTLSGNKYHSSLVGGYAFNIGTGSGDVSGASFNKSFHLYTDRDNSALLAAYAATYSGNSSTAHGGTHPSLANLSVTLKGYTLHKDGTWNTIALPFDFANINYDSSPLKGAIIKELDTSNTAYDSETGIVTVAFKTVTSITKAKPYIVKWTTGGDDIIDPTFIQSANGSYFSNSISTTNDAPVKIQGSCAKPFTLADDMLFDAHNTDNRGCHAAITLSAPTVPDGYTFDGWYTDEARTAAVNTIPFGTDGGFCLYSRSYPTNLTLNAATLFGESKYVTTFYHGTLDYQLPTGARAYTASLDGEKMVFHLVGEDGSVIPSATAVIIVADAASVTLSTLASTEVTAYAGNILQGSDSVVAVSGLSGTPYVLNISGGTLGFYKFTGASIPAGKAYYLKSE